MSETVPHILSLDIGTEYVKAVIAKPARRGELDIVGVGKARQAPENMFGGAISDIHGVIQTCEEALSQAEQDAGFTTTNVVVGLAGELVKSGSTTIKYLRADPAKPIEEAEVSNLIHTIQKKAEDRARREFLEEAANTDTELRLISSAITAIFIDGHKVSSPVGFKGKELDVTLYTAFAPLVHISAIEKVCTELRLDLLTIAVEPFAVARACLGLDPESSLSTIIIDVGGGTTDVAIIDRGGIVSTRMFNVAGRAFTHAIAVKLDVDQASAEKLKTHIDDPRLKPVVHTKIDQALAENLEIWLSGVDLALRDLEGVDRLPDQIYLSGGGASLELIPETLATGDWYRELPFVRRPIVDLLEFSILPGFNNLTDADLDHTFATALGLLRVAADTDFATSPDDPNSLRARLRRLLKN
jgi:cell division protein FtsA